MKANRGTTALSGALFLCGSGFGQTTELASVDSSGNQGNGASYFPSISGNGRYVAFESQADDLVPGDTNGWEDIFVHDRRTGTTELVSTDSSGNQGDSGSKHPDISEDGRYVAFLSWASNLVAGDTNGVPDIFVHDRQMGVTERVSVDSSGNQGNGASFYPAISGDGRYVTFQSSASNLVAGDANGVPDVFVHDRLTGATELASVDSSGNQGNLNSEYPDISSDGRYVAFQSGANNLIPLDANGYGDIFVHDRWMGTTELVSVDSSGNQGDYFSQLPSLSADGRRVAFQSQSTNLVRHDTNGVLDIFFHDRKTGTTERVSVDSSGKQANLESQNASTSADGRYVAFDSLAWNLVPGDTNNATDTFVRDRWTGATERASVGSTGHQAWGESWDPAISGDGRYTAFYSSASNLVPFDTNGFGDVFVRDRGAANP